MDKKFLEIVKKHLIFSRPDKTVDAYSDKKPL